MDRVENTYKNNGSDPKSIIESAFNINSKQILNLIEGKALVLHKTHTFRARFLIA